MRQFAKLTIRREMPPAGHQVAGQDEEGNGHDGGGLQAAKHALCDNGRRNAQVAQSHSGQRADAQGHGNGDSDQNADCEDQKQDNASIHDTSPPSS